MGLTGQKAVWYNDDMKTCSMCLQPQPLSEFHSAGNNGKYKRRVCKSCRSAMRKEQRQSPEFLANERRKRNEHYAKKTGEDFALAIEAYGGMCKCGENRLEALVLHHIKDKNGVKILPITKKGNPWFYSQLRKLKYPKGLIVLCGTCHLILHRKEMKNASW